MKNYVINPAIVLGFMLGAALAHAEPGGYGGSGEPDRQQHGQMEGKIFKEMDSNNDDAISRAEFDAFQARRFKETDTNSDGKITREEINAAREKMVDKVRSSRFDEADANHDGVLTREEAGKMPVLSRNFDKVDANRDGKVTREEMDAEMGRVRGSRESRK